MASRVLSPTRFNLERADLANLAIQLDDQCHYAVPVILFGSPVQPSTIAMYLNLMTIHFGYPIQEGEGRPQDTRGRAHP